MLDLTKISFHEIDDTGIPLQIFYHYDLMQTEIEKIVEEYATEDEVPKGMHLYDIELCLSVYSRNDFKLEAVCTNDNAEQFWFELHSQFTNADELLQLIPDLEKEKSYGDL